MLWTAHYYDDWGRSLKSYAQHYLGGTLSNNNYDAISTTYNFTNAPTTVTRQHFNTGSTTTPLVTIANRYIYDQVGRKQKTWEQITNGTTATTRTLISNLVYNEIGQVATKKLHSTDSVAFLQNIAYTYNERGWLYTSTAPLFQMLLYYNTAVGSKMYNGNIVAQFWGQGGSYTNHFNYAYDKLNRLRGGASADGYGDEGIVYDLMGNMIHLYRFKATVEVDQLTYSYLLSGNPTNQVQSIVDAGNNDGLVSGTTTYTYDGNGNTLSNTNTVNTGQNKSYTYNLLNLPLVATVPTGTATYTYDATGNKLRKVDVLGGTTTTTDYINGIEYDNSSSTIGFIQTEEGKAVPLTGGGYDYVYYLGDNLGNTRVTFGTHTGSTVTYQVDDYYPFGLEINRTPYVPKNEYLYNRKELQEETGLYDFGARGYDPLIARWLQIDPMAEYSRRWSPYNYVMDNPIRFIDPDGMDTEGASAMASYVNGTYANNVTGYTNAYTANDNDTHPKPNVSVNVQATQGVDNDISVTQTTTTTTITPTATGSIIIRTVQTITDIVSVSEHVDIKPGDAITTTSITTIDNGNTTVVNGSTTTQKRSTADVSVLTSIDKHLNNFKIANHVQLIQDNHEKGVKLMDIVGGVAALPFALAIATPAAIAKGLWSNLFDAVGAPLSKPALSSFEVNKGMNMLNTRTLNLYNSRNGYIFYDAFQIRKKFINP